MLIYITGVAGSGKSTLREELTRIGYQAQDADEAFCAWFDEDGYQVPTLPLPERTPEWYATHSYRLLPERVSEFAHQCDGTVGFLLGIASNTVELSSQFAANFYLTADASIILERLRGRDGAAYATRFAAFSSVQEWQTTGGENGWVKQGYTPIDSSRAPADIAATLLTLIPPQG
jgi:cytidylate kinase